MLNFEEISTQLTSLDTACKLKPQDLSLCVLEGSNELMAEAETWVSAEPDVDTQSLHCVREKYLRT